MKELTIFRKRIATWRSKILQRDDFICQKCFVSFAENPKKLIAHHIKSRKEYPDLIFEFDNGQTLCIFCHSSFHSSGENNPMYGTTHSESHKEKISNSLRGKKQTEETKEKRRKSLKGHVVSSSTREKIRMSNLGKFVSNETRKKQSDAKIGRPSTNKGKTASEETKLKRSISLKSYWENKRRIINDLKWQEASGESDRACS